MIWWLLACTSKAPDTADTAPERATVCEGDDGHVADPAAAVHVRQGGDDDIPMHRMDIVVALPAMPEYRVMVFWRF